MNELMLFARFDIAPSEQVQQQVEVAMKSFIREIAPDAELAVKTGYGSWWIVVSGIAVPVGGWLALQFAGWLVKKGFDHIAAKAKERAATRHADTSSQSTDLPMLVGSAYDGQSSFEKGLSQLAILLPKMNYLAESVGANQIVFGEWSQETGLGRVISLQRKENEVALNLYQTDSRDDFNSRNFT
jgi:hypothetical protein